MKLRVLVALADEVTAAALVALLEQDGHEVTARAEGPAVLPREDFDVVVADARPRESAASAAIGALLASTGGPRLVVLCDPADHGGCLGVLRPGVDTALSLPVAIEEIARAVAAAGRPRPSAVFERAYPAAPGAADRAARDLVAHALRCGISPAARARIGTVCAELVQNVVDHAFPSGVGSVRVIATVEPRRLDLSIADDGAGFDPLDPRLDDMTDCSARGLARATALCEDLRIESAPGAGTRVHASFHVAGALFEEEDTLDLSELDWLPPEAAREVLEVCAEDPEGAARFVLSPALAVTLGRLLAGPDPRRALRAALWS